MEQTLSITMKHHGHLSQNISKIRTSRLNVYKIIFRMNFDPEFLFPDHISLGNLRYIFKIFLDKFEEVPDIPVLR